LKGGLEQLVLLHEHLNVFFERVIFVLVKSAALLVVLVEVDGSPSAGTSPEYPWVSGIVGLQDF